MEDSEIESPSEEPLNTLGIWRQFANRIEPKLNHDAAETTCFTVDVSKM